MPLRKVPLLEVLEKECDPLRWGGRFSISTSYYDTKFYRMGKVSWSSSWEDSLQDAIQKANINKSWITLIYRSKDSTKSGYRMGKLRFLGYVDQQGKLHLFKYFLPLTKAIETAFRELGLEVIPYAEIEDVM